MKIIFLDVDGVLNSERSFIAGSWRAHQYAKDNPGDPYYKKITKCTIDPIACDLVNKIIRDFDAKLVISSTHRKHFDNGPEKLDQLKEYFTFLGINGDAIIGWTKSLWPEGDTEDERKEWYAHGRGHEIKDWLDEHPGWTHYVIIDDSSDMREDQMDNFVRVPGEFGFTIKNYRDVTKIFGTEDIGRVFL